MPRLVGFALIAAGVFAGCTADDRPPPPPPPMVAVLPAPATRAVVTTRPAMTAVTAWSEPDGGLVARIEQAGSTVGAAYYNAAVFVRLRNVGSRRLIVPTFAARWSWSSFRVEVWSDGAWERSPLADDGGTPVQPYVLGPGDDVLCALPLFMPGHVRRGDAVRVTLDVPPRGDGLWAGSVTTPARPVYVPPTEAERLAGTVPMPRVVPPLAYTQSLPMGCRSGDEPPYQIYVAANWGLLEQMSLYPEPDVVGWLGRQLDAATDPQWRLFLAAELAVRGSAAGRAVVTSTDGTTRDGPVVGRIAALERLARLDPPPKWATDTLAELGVDPREYSFEKPHLQEPAPVDSKAVALLLQRVQNDRDAQVVVGSIDQLSRCRNGTAVSGLIDAYGFDLNRENVLSTGSPDDLRDRITAALRELTGRPFGPDAAEWRAWWERDGRADPRFR